MKKDKTHARIGYVANLKFKVAVKGDRGTTILTEVWPVIDFTGLRFQSEVKKY